MSNNQDLGNGLVLGQRRGWLWTAVPAILVLGLAVILFRGTGEARRQGTTFTARRGPLEIAVSERGSVEALESQDYRSHIRGYSGARILSIVEEGYVVTEEDVKEGKILIELDSTELRDRLIERTSRFQELVSQLVEAQQSQKSQILANESRIQTARLDVKFASMDLEKYLGQQAAVEIIDQLGLPPEEEADEGQSEAPSVGTEEDKSGRGSEVADSERSEERRGRDADPGGRRDLDSDSEEVAEADGEEASLELFAELHVELGATEIQTELPPIDFSKYAKRELLGDGAAQQRLRELEDDYVLAQEELTLAGTQLEGTQRLAEQGFVTKNDLEKDEMAVKRGTIRLASAETAQNLFIKYEFPKQAEQLVSDYVESLRELDRVRLEAEAQMTRARGRLESRIAKYEIDKAELEETQDQIDECIIRAEHTGLVVYASSLDDFDPEEDRIKEGANIRRRRKIITIPDTNKMGVKMKVHESAVRKIVNGQKARIQVDAFPDRQLVGEVVKVSVLPDAKERAANPDVKVYPVSVLIDGYHEWLKPGMTAQAEVLVKTLDDVVYVPIQAIVPRGLDRVCYVVKGKKSAAQVVETGDYNDTFIEILGGLEEGDEVLLRAPEGAEPTESDLTDDQIG